MAERSRPVAPTGIAPPAANYVHAVLTVEATRWLHTSGVVPIGPDGSVPEQLADQADVVWNNIGAMLTDAEMTSSNVVSVTTYVRAEQDLSVVMAARDRFLGDHRAASTLVVAELARPEWLMEVAVVAAG